MAAIRQSREVAPNTGKIPSMNPNARLRAIFSGVIPWVSSWRIGARTRFWKNCFIRSDAPKPEASRRRLLPGACFAADEGLHHFAFGIQHQEVRVSAHRQDAFIRNL